MKRGGGVDDDNDDGGNGDDNGGGEGGWRNVRICGFDNVELCNCAEDDKCPESCNSGAANTHMCECDMVGWFVKWFPVAWLLRCFGCAPALAAHCGTSITAAVLSLFSALPLTTAPGDRDRLCAVATLWTTAAAVVVLAVEAVEAVDNPAASQIGSGSGSGSNVTVVPDTGRSTVDPRFAAILCLGLVGLKLLLFIGSVWRLVPGAAAMPGDGVVVISRVFALGVSAEDQQASWTASDWAHEFLTKTEVKLGDYNLSGKQIEMELALRGLVMALQDESTTVQLINLHNPSYGLEADGTMGQELAVSLADALKDNTVVQTIRLKRQEIGPEGGMAMAAMLQVNTAVQEIDMSSNGLGSEFGAALSKALEVNTALRSINLEDNELGPDGGRALAEALKKNPNTVLQKINLYGNKLGPRGGTALADMLKTNSSVQEINLENNEMEAMGGEAIAHALKMNTTLQKVNLGRNDLRSAGIAVAEALHTNATVHSINLEQNYLSNEGGMVLAEALKINTTLQFVNLGCNDFIDQKDPDCPPTTTGRALEGAWGARPPDQLKL